MLLANLLGRSYKTAAGGRIETETSTRTAKFVIVWIDRWHWWFQFVCIQFKARLLLQSAGRRHIMFREFYIHRMGCRLHFWVYCCCCSWCRCRCCSSNAIVIVWWVFMRCANIKQITTKNIPLIDDLYIAWNEAFYWMGRAVVFRPFRCLIDVLFIWCDVLHGTQLIFVHVDFDAVFSFCGAQMAITLNVHCAQTHSCTHTHTNAPIMTDMTIKLTTNLCAPWLCIYWIVEHS